MSNMIISNREVPDALQLKLKLNYVLAHYMGVGQL